MKEKIIELLMSTEREGIADLISHIGNAGFFESPASTKYHGCVEGGLAEHSYNLYEMLSGLNKKLELGISNGTVIIAALLHDVCKIGAYIGDCKPYRWNRSQPKGHARLSIERIKEHIELTDLEELMIKYHMGVYGLIEFEERSGEYNLRGGQMMNAWYHHPIVKVMYFCDELETLEAKTKE